jgi:hypothetical protein
MMGRARHLDNDRLFECYLADSGSQPVDPPTAEHLADCGACSERYMNLVALFNELRSEADAEADEIFTVGHLRQQQEQILRRIEHLNHSARVISFPGRVGRQIAGGTARVAPRWLAAAAAAGLFVGVGVGGTLLRPGVVRGLPGMRAGTGQSAAARLAPAPVVRVGSSPSVLIESFDDDMFLLELEFALERPHTQELQPFDALTPHVQEIDVRVR